MIKQTIARMRARISGTDSLDDRKKRELLHLLESLEEEVGHLSATRTDDAEKITGFMHISTAEAIREPKDQELLDLAREGLSLSIRGFETSHPKLVQTVNNISTMLSNLGI